MAGKDIITLLLQVFTPAVVIGILLLFYPEKFEIWSSLLWKLLSRFGGLFKSAHKHYVKHDLQGRINSFVKRLCKEVPSLIKKRLRIEWVGPNIDRKSFIEKDTIVLRLRRDDLEDQNFIHGTYLFVSCALLQKPKRYLSPSQRDAIDLFVCSKLIKEEKPELIDFFLSDYLHPRTEDPKSKVSIYIDDFSTMDNGGLFFPVFVQELRYLGDKIFGAKLTHLVRAEVNNLIKFLKPIAIRTVGDKGDLDYDGKYCKFAIVIIGKRLVIGRSIQPYITFIEKELVKRQGSETIYLLSHSENKDKVNKIAENFEPHYECANRRHFNRRLKFSGTDKSEFVLTFLVVLRKRGVELIEPSQS